MFKMLLKCVLTLATVPPLKCTWRHSELSGSAVPKSSDTGRRNGAGRKRPQSGACSRGANTPASGTARVHLKAGSYKQQRTRGARSAFTYVGINQSMSETQVNTA